MGNTGSHHKSHNPQPRKGEPFAKQGKKSPQKKDWANKFSNYSFGVKKTSHNHQKYNKVRDEEAPVNYARHRRQDATDYLQDQSDIKNVNQQRSPKRTPYPLESVLNFDANIEARQDEEVRTLKRKFATLEKKVEDFEKVVCIQNVEVEDLKKVVFKQNEEVKDLKKVVLDQNQKVEDLKKVVFTQNKIVEQILDDLKERMAAQEKKRSKKKVKRTKTNDIDTEATTSFSKKGWPNSTLSYQNVEMLHKLTDIKPSGGNKVVNLKEKLLHPKTDILINHDMKEVKEVVTIPESTSKHKIDSSNQIIQHTPSKKKRNEPVSRVDRSIRDPDHEPASLPTIENVYGIEGRNNSCYMDSSLNSMFLFTKAFKKFLEKDSSNGNSTTSNQMKNERNVDEVRKLLYEEIVTPLHKNKILSLDTGTMAKFRKLLSTFNASFDGNEMDPEEFISTLFGNILKTIGFYCIDGDDEGSYVFQTYADMSKPRDETDVQTLLEYSFTDSQIQLESIPRPGFIIKMPVTDGRHMFTKVYPNLRIDLKNILKKDLFDEIETKMQLSAVICLSSHHFTAYVREGEMKSSPWWYLDSFSSSKAKKHLDMDKALESQNRSLDRRMSLLMANCYMCLYLPISSSSA